MTDKLYFNDEWMECEPLHTHVIDVAAEMIYEICRDDPDRIEYMTNFFFHFTSLWYQRMIENRGVIVLPTVSSCALFAGHMVEVHDMDPAVMISCVQILTRFAALVITKAGGRLV